MKKRLLPVMVVFAMFFLLSTAFAGEGGKPLDNKTPAPGAPGGGKSVAFAANTSWTGRYTIVKGDTLWDISKARLSDPFAWPRIWKKNPFIHNPNLIYPGQVIKLPTGVTIAPPKAAKEVAPPPVVERERGPFVSRGTTLTARPHVSGTRIITIPPPPVRIPVATRANILEAGFVDEGGIKPRSIKGSPKPQALYGLFDKLYVNTDGFKAGDRFIIGRYEGKVEDPGTGDTLGRLVKASGVLEIKGPKDGFMLGVITKAFTDIKISDMLFPYQEPVIVYEPVPPNPKAYGVSGYIAALSGGRHDDTQADILYIDKGAKDGVLPGDSFVVKRPGGYARNNSLIGGSVPLPDVTAGRIEVISVGKHTAAAKVVNSDGPLKAGYSIYYSRPK